jgi:hypothetical protein
VALTGTGVNLAVTPANLAFLNQRVGTNSTSQTLTVHNSTGASRHLTITLAAPFSRTGGTCGASLGNNASCTINVRFNAPANPGEFAGSVAIGTDTGFTVANSPVSLTGFAVPAPAAVVAAGP